jgi:predicted amidohydrolase
MRDIRIAAAQFEHRDGDKAHNLGRIRELANRAASQGAGIVCFHECSITAYTFLQTLSPDELIALAEPVPDGPSVAALTGIARETRAVIMAGLIEREPDGRLFNCYVTVGPEGFIAKFHKLHPFISPYLTPGRGYHVAEILGVKVGFLICYDNNLPENVRATTLLGAEVIVMPHVTGCTPSPMPGRGTVAPSLWENRARDPARLRQEFQGPKGRGWLMRWLPARAWENGVFAVFANNIGRDFDSIKPGLAMILDPSGEVIVESHALDDDVVVGLLTAEAVAQAPGPRYLRARRPELYGKLVEPHPPAHRSVTSPGWRLAFEPDASVTEVGVAKQALPAKLAKE